jgi:hypothetical protein
LLEPPWSRERGVAATATKKKWCAVEELAAAMWNEE